VGLGVLPLTFVNPDDYDRLKPGTIIKIATIAEALKAGQEIEVTTDAGTIILHYSLSKRQIDILMAGGAINRQLRGKGSQPGLTRE
jgi:aconitate hydratase